jgi:hypothetical protein
MVIPECPVNGIAVKTKIATSKARRLLITGKA